MAKKKNDEEEGTEAAAPVDGVRLNAHPKAREHLAIAKGWGGIISFSAVAAASSSAGLPMTDLLLHSLLGGITGSMLAWGLTLTVWRHLALAQIEGLRRKLVHDIDEQRRALEAGVSADRAALEQRVLAEAAAARNRAPDGAMNT